MIQAILGPTASGKSELAAQVVAGHRALGREVEVVAVDAFTIYRGMDIGTAKPSATELARAPHHLIDVLDPDADVNVAWFQQLARDTIAAIRTRGAVALLVGGSGLYWRAVVDDLQFPPTDDAVRAALEARYLDDAAAAHARLAREDPEAAAGIAVENVRRTIRALEVGEVTGRPFSSFQRGWGEPAPGYEGVEVAYLEPDAAWLRAAIHRRAQAMVDQGLLVEAEDLRARTRLSRTATQAIGYAEAFAVLDGTAPADGLASRIATRTWRYAKRQRAWFRADRRCVPVSADRARRDLVG